MGCVIGGGRTSDELPWFKAVDGSSVKRSVNSPTSRFPSRAPINNTPPQRVATRTKSDKSGLQELIMIMNAWQASCSKPLY